MRIDEILSIFTETVKNESTSGASQTDLSHTELAAMQQTRPLPSKRMGERLIDANLLTPAQLQVGLYDQQQFAAMRLGEIFVFRGWLNQKTVDFFGDHWRQTCHHPNGSRQSLGDYLYAAGLMDQQSIQQIIAEQHRNGYRFGANAVLLGFIKQETLDYFLENLFPDEKNESHYVINAKQRIMHPRHRVTAEISAQKNFNSHPEIKLKQNRNHQSTPYPPATDDDISWVG